MAEELSPLAGIMLGQDPPAAETPAAQAIAQQPDPDPKDREGEPSATAPSEPESDLTITPPEVEPALSVKRLAEKLDMPIDDLYRDLVIDVGGESVSLSKLKDRAKDLFRSEELLNDAQANKLESENELLRRNRELALAVQRLGREPTEAERTEAETLHNQYVQTENRRTLAAIPDWSDASTRTKDIEGIASLLTEYGFSPAEMAATVDHRHVKLLRDYQTMRARLKQAGKSEVRTGKPIPSSRKRVEAGKKSAGERFKAGELSQSQAILQAIADGAT